MAVREGGQPQHPSARVGVERAEAVQPLLEERVLLVGAHAVGGVGVLVQRTEVPKDAEPRDVRRVEQSLERPCDAGEVGSARVGVVLGQPRVGERSDGKAVTLVAGRLDEVGEGEEGFFGQRLTVGEDAALLCVLDDPLRVEEGDGPAHEDKLQGNAAALAPQLKLLLVGQARLLALTQGGNVGGR